MFFEKFFKTYIHVHKVNLLYIYIYVLMTMRLTGMRLTGTPFLALRCVYLGGHLVSDLSILFKASL